MPVRVQLGVGFAQRRRVLIRDGVADGFVVGVGQCHGVGGGQRQRDPYRVAVQRADLLLRLMRRAQRPHLHLHLALGDGVAVGDDQL